MFGRAAFFLKLNTMGFFASEKVMPTFASRSDAFDFMLADRLSKGDDYHEAAEKADKFADIITKNKKLPATPPKPKTGIEAAVGYVEQIVAVKRDHPEVWDLVVGGIGGLISGFAVLTGNKSNPAPSEDIQMTPINFDEIQ